MSVGTLLILEDDLRFADLAGKFARQIGFDPHPVTTLGEAVRMASKRRFDCALVDIGLPDGCGLDLFAEPRLASTRKIVMSGDASLAGWAARSVPGALGALTKPFRFSTFRELLDRSCPAPQPGRDLLGRSTAMRAAVDELDTVARSRFPVLIHGESGTGKELAARLVHDRSGRSGPFIPVNCAALSAELLASQLFGHRRGSFTGAVGHEAGLVAQADGGTLFLDELAEAPPTVQAALLRFLESGEVLALGAHSPKRVDARIVAATNVDPRRAVDEGRLRADLYFRVAGYEVRMPPLRERPEDVDVIAQSILDELNREYGKARRFVPGAFDAVRGDRWRGNVRELRQRVQRAWLEGDEALILGRPASESHRQTRDSRTLDDIEREAILDALLSSAGDRAMAAARLGISTRTIYNKLSRYRGDVPDAPLPKTG